MNPPESNTGSAFVGIVRPLAHKPVLPPPSSSSELSRFDTFVILLVMVAAVVDFVLHILIEGLS